MDKIRNVIILLWIAAWVALILVANAANEILGSSSVDATQVEKRRP